MQRSLQVEFRDALGIFLVFVMMIYIGPAFVDAIFDKFFPSLSEVEEINSERVVYPRSLFSKILIEFLALILTITLMLERVCEKSLSDAVRQLGFGFPKNRIWLLAFIPGVFLAFLQGLGSVLFPPYEGYQGNELIGQAGEISLEILLSIFVLVVLVGPVLEELIFRQILFVPLRRFIGAWSGMFICCMVFVLFHYSIWAKGYWVAIMSLSVSSMLFGWFRIKSDSLIPAILGHQGLNFSVLVASIYLGSV